MGLNAVVSYINTFLGAAVKLALLADLNLVEFLIWRGSYKIMVG